MPSPLLSTKLSIPPSRRAHLSRERLHTVLAGSGRRKLTLLCAPAGYGKSTLLMDYLESADDATAWLTLDEDDNDIRRFLAYLVAALQRVDKTIARSDTSVSQMPMLGLSQTLLTMIVNALVNLPFELIVVLDDYHLIHNDEIHDAVAFLAEHAPPNVHLIVSTRSEPPLPLARWRARGELCEITENDLRFSHNEVRGFLERVMNLRLTERDVFELEKRTEGWVAGLQLAALSLQGRENVGAFIETFTGTDRYILDYLTEEVLVRLDSDMQDFLVMISFLERLNGSLCDAVTLRSDSQTRLEKLERDNLFLTPLDNQRNWYRFHIFFADLLRQRLEAARPDLVPTLQSRASHYFEQHDMPVESLRHALAAGDHARAATLIEAHPFARAVRRELLRLLKMDEHGQGLETLFAEAQRRGISATEGSRLLAAFEEPPEPNEPELPLEIESLSDRELEVLKLIAGGLSNKAVAQRLDISLNTVKTHTKNIHGKLQVGSRTQAIARAQELGLI